MGSRKGNPHGSQDRGAVALERAENCWSRYCLDYRTPVFAPSHGFLQSPAVFPELDPQECLEWISCSPSYNVGRDAIEAVELGQAFGEVSGKVMVALFGTLGLMKGFLWLIVYVPKKTLVILSSFGESISKAWVNPKR